MKIRSYPILILLSSLLLSGYILKPINSKTSQRTDVQKDSFAIILNKIVDGTQNDFAGIKGTKILGDPDVFYLPKVILPGAANCKISLKYKDNPSEYNASFFTGKDKSSADQVFETIRKRVEKSLPSGFEQDPYEAKNELIQGALFFHDRNPGGKQPCLYLSESYISGMYKVDLRIYGL